MANDKDARTNDQNVPADWTRSLVAHWDKADACEVLVRRGPKGAPRALKNGRVLLDQIDESAGDVRVLCEDICQGLWDVAYAHHISVGGTTDVIFVVEGRDAEGRVIELERVTRGGRLRGGESEDVEEDTTFGNFNRVITVLLGGIERLTRLHCDTVDRNIATLNAVQPFAGAAAKVEEARISAETEAYKADKAEQILANLTERMAPFLNKFAEARATEAAATRARTPVGEKVIDAWRKVIDTTDLPTARRIREILGDTGVELMSAIEVGDNFGRREIIELWQRVKKDAKVLEKWEELLRTLPERTRGALAELADAVRSTEPA